MDEAVAQTLIFLKELKNDNACGVEPQFSKSYTLLPEESNTELSDWIFNYLEQRNCPHLLALYLTRCVVEKVQDSVQTQGEGFNSTLILSNALKKLNEVIDQILHPSSELGLRKVVERGELLPFDVSVFAIKNKRRKMEDRHVIIHDLNMLLGLKDVPSHSYYAVFDGHAGVDAASYAAAHLHMNLAKHPDFFTDTPKAIQEAYKLTDSNFCRKAATYDIKSGCTAVTALIREKTLYLAWLGDSQALLIDKGCPIAIMMPHKPNRSDERERIESLGGFVHHIGTWRVNGALAVSRALGDHEFKPYVSGEPEVNVIPLNGSEDFLILACDGLWDGMSPRDVAFTLYTNLASNSSNASADVMAEKLVQQSKQQGSDDNITVVVIFLRNVEAILKDAENNIVRLQQMCDASVAFPSLEIGDSHPERPRVLENIVSFPSLCPEAQKRYSNEKFELVDSTDFSELPTPPIDDISNHFSGYCIQSQASGMQLDVENDLLGGTDSSNVGENTEMDSLIDVTNDLPVSEPYASSLDENSSLIMGNSVAEELMAKTESITKCINTSGVSLIELNPNAEPFVPKIHSPSGMETITLDSCTKENMLLKEFSAITLVESKVSGVVAEDSKVSEVVVEESKVSEVVVEESKVSEVVVEESKVSEVVAEEFNISERVVESKEDAEEAPGGINKMHLGSEPEKSVHDALSSAFSLAPCSVNEQSDSLNTSQKDSVDDMSYDLKHVPVEVEGNKSTDYNTTEQEQLQESRDATFPVLEHDPCKKATQEPSVDVDIIHLNAQVTESTIAVDLQSVPDGIPEAEGVCEDIDSDSEKDGGWSYMKAANNDLNCIVQPSETSPAPEVERAPDVQEQTRCGLVKANRAIASKQKFIPSTSKPKKSDTTDKTVPAIKNLPVSSRISSRTSAQKTGAQQASSISRARQAIPVAPSAGKPIKQALTKPIGSLKPAESMSKGTVKPTSSSIDAAKKEASGKSITRPVASNTIKNATKALTRPLSTLSAPKTSASSTPKTAATVSGPKSISSSSSVKPGVTRAQKSPMAHKVAISPSGHKTTNLSVASKPATSGVVQKSSVQKSLPSKSSGLGSKSVALKLNSAETKAIPSRSVVKKSSEAKETKNAVNKQIVARKVASSNLVSKTMTVAKGTNGNKKGITSSSSVPVNKIKSSVDTVALQAKKKSVPLQDPKKNCEEDKPVSDGQNSVVIDQKNGSLSNSDAKLCQSSSEKYNLECDIKEMQLLSSDSAQQGKATEVKNESAEAMAAQELQHHE